MHRENLIRTLHRFATSPGADVHEWDNNNQQFGGGVSTERFGGSVKVPVTARNSHP
jgi:hypothetical protein